jgi:hypothetical protein
MDRDKDMVELEVGNGEDNRIKAEITTQTKDRRAPTDRSAHGQLYSI